MLFLIPFSSNAGRFPRQKGTGKWGGGGGGTGICKEFAKRAFIIFVFVLWALVFSLRCVAPFFCPSLFSFTLVGNRPEQEHRKKHGVAIAAGCLVARCCCLELVYKRKTKNWWCWWYFCCWTRVRAWDAGLYNKEEGAAAAAATATTTGRGLGMEAVDGGGSRRW